MVSMPLKEQLCLFVHMHLGFFVYIGLVMSHALDLSLCLEHTRLPCSFGVRAQTVHSTYAVLLSCYGVRWGGAGF